MVLDVTQDTPTIAVLIDADNVGIDSLDRVLNQLAGRGEITIRRAYGNWFKAALKRWDSELSRRSIKAIQQSDPVKGKNATDIALTIDAIDLHHTLDPDIFALVSSDSDYGPLAIYLREHGASVIGVGRANTPGSFKAACSEFLAIVEASPTKPNSEPKRVPSLTKMLTDAITKNADNQGWARVSTVANQLRQQHGQTAKDHGKATWTKVFKSMPGYEFRDEGTTNVAVRVAKRA